MSEQNIKQGSSISLEPKTNEFLRLFLHPIRIAIHLKSTILIVSTFTLMVAMFAVASFVPFWIVQSSVFSRWLPSNLSINDLADASGFANALFSALAFAGVLVTLTLQMIELKAQRMEVADMQKGQMLQAHLSALTLRGSLGDEDADFEANYIAEFLRGEAMSYLESSNINLKWTILCAVNKRLSDINNLICNITRENIEDSCTRLSKQCREFCFFLRNICTGRKVGLTVEEVFALGTFQEVFMVLSEMTPLIKHYVGIGATFEQMFEIRSCMICEIQKSLIPIRNSSMQIFLQENIDCEMLKSLSSDSVSSLNKFVDKMNAKVVSMSLMSPESVPENEKPPRSTE